jgi:hypothetical protein
MRDIAQALLRTLPLRIQRVHTRIRCTPPLIAARTSCRFGFHRRLVLLLAWLTLFPTEGCLPQIVQCLIAINLGSGQLKLALIGRTLQISPSSGAIKEGEISREGSASYAQG